MPTQKGYWTIYELAGGEWKFPETERAYKG